MRTFDLLDSIQALQPGAVDEYGNLKAFMDRYAAREKTWRPTAHPGSSTDEACGACEGFRVLPPTLALGSSRVQYARRKRLRQPFLPRTATPPRSSGVLPSGCLSNPDKMDAL